MRLQRTVRDLHRVVGCSVLLGVFPGAQPAPLLAHPHHHIEQQAQLTISADSVELVLRIVPSIGEGAAMFDSIDLDGDGNVSAAEATAFGSDIIPTADLRRGGRSFRFGEPSLAIPTRELVAQGRGVIEVRAVASFDGREQAADPIEFEITYHRFSPTWFVQPFVSRDLYAAMSSVVIERGEGAKVRVALTP